MVKNIVSSIAMMILLIIFLNLKLAYAIDLYDPDDFEEPIVAGEETQNWYAGPNCGSFCPSRIDSGGALGDGGWLQLSSDGSGSGGKLVAQNMDDKWAGNWTDAGVKNIEMYLKNLGDVSLQMRLALIDTSSGSPGSGVSYSVGCTLAESILLDAGDGEWQREVFPVEASDFECFGGTNADAMLLNVTMLRLMHATGSSLNGSGITSQVGVDNIVALPYILTLSIVGQGTLDPPAGDNYIEDDSTTITATPSAGWQFDSWSGDLTGNANPATITMDSNKEITASFSAIDYGLFITIEPEGIGSVELNPPGGNYQYDDEVTLTAVPDPYWELVRWEGDLSGSASPTTITIDGDKSVSAVFALKDTDGDGITDQEEDSGPNGGDANNDGTSDLEQQNVTSLKSYDDQYHVVLESPPGTTLVGVQSLPNPDQTNSPSWVQFEYGFFEFVIEGVGIGGATTVTITLPEGSTPNTYYKYGPTPSVGTDNLYKFKYDSVLQTGAQFNGNVITLHLIDGQLGDDDLTANGVIIDPGGPGIINSGSGSDSRGPTGGSGSDGNSGGGVLGGCFISTVNNSPDF